MNPFKNDPIIIVEDDQDDQLLLKHICLNLKIRNELIFFEDGIQAFEYLTTTTNNTFLILCDINMPLMDGLELRSKLINDKNLKLKSIPFVFLSTTDTRSQIVKAYELDVQGFFSKGVSFDEFEKELSIVFQYWKYCKKPS